MRIFIFVLVFIYSSLLYAQTIDPTKLQHIVQRGKETNSDGLIILQNNKVLVEEYFDQPKTPTYIASVSKALTSIAIFKLLDEGKIKSIDQPVADFYPEWKQGQKKDITLRMIMNHTSGIQNIANARLEIETGPQGKGDDLVKLALAAEITDKPGTVFSYNNKATGLLAGIIEVASGKRMDTYFEETFFKPMGITKWEWKTDGTGRPKSMGGFVITAMDLAKFGQLMLQRGSYNGTKFFDERWIDSALAFNNKSPNPMVGLIWWKQSTSNILHFKKDKITDLQKSSLPETMLTLLSGFYNRTFTSDELTKAFEDNYGKNFRQSLDTVFAKMPGGLQPYLNIEPQGVDAYYHTGSWGNYLYIIPELKMVAVRVVKKDAKYDEARDKFGDFQQLVMDLLKK